MSGSLVLRSGVGTQMLMVSRSRTTEKSVVARKRWCLPSLATSAEGTSCTYDSPRLRPSTLDCLHVDAGDVESGLGELDRQRQADIAQPDDADAGGFRFDFPFERFECCDSLFRSLHNVNALTSAQPGSYSRVPPLELSNKRNPQPTIVPWVKRCLTRRQSAKAAAQQSCRCGLEGARLQLRRKAGGSGGPLETVSQPVSPLCGSQ